MIQILFNSITTILLGTCFIAHTANASPEHKQESQSTVTQKITYLTVFEPLEKNFILQNSEVLEAFTSFRMLNPEAYQEVLSDIDQYQHSSLDKISLPINIQRIIKIINESQFNELFTHRDSIYTYYNFLKAAAKWPRFCDEVSNDYPFVSGMNREQALEKTCRAELASLFAHFVQETGRRSTENSWLEGLYYREEIGCADNQCFEYNQSCSTANWPGVVYPCSQSYTYHGRGAKQLSHNYNYGLLSRFLFGDMRLLDNPDLLIEDGVLAFSSAIFFYMFPRSPKPSIHETVTGLWTPTERDRIENRRLGFGVQTLIVNGAIECNKGEPTPQDRHRAKVFFYLANYFSVWENWFESTKSDCSDSQPFSSSNRKLNIAAVSETKCDYVAWEETGFYAFIPGDLQRCERSLKQGLYPKIIEE